MATKDRDRGPTWPAGAAHDPRRPIVCGHRGAPGVEPENTLASFRSAAERGATWVEFDVRPSGDGELVIHHDPVTAAGVHVGSSDRADLPASVPTLAELARAERTLGFDIEMKTDDIAMSLHDFVGLVADQIDTHCAGRPDLIVTSFSAEALELFRDRKPDVATGLLFWQGDPAASIALAADIGHVAVAPSIRMLDEALVERARAARLGVATWTVNTTADIRRAVDLGVDMIIGDDPASIVAEAALDRGGEHS